MEINMKMSPDYQVHSSFQQDVNKLMLKTIHEQIENMNKNRPERFSDEKKPFCIADLGCANGLNSVPLLSSCIKLIRSINPAMPIVIYLNDLPENDFNLALKNVTNGLSEFPKVHTFCRPGSFYTELFPEDSLDLCFSVCSLHWVSELPAISDTLGFDYSKTSVQTEDDKKWKELADRDWIRFLNKRQSELRIGAQMLISTVNYDEKFPGKNAGYRNYSKITKYAMKNVIKKHQMETYEFCFNVPNVLSEGHYKNPFTLGSTPLVLEEYRYDHIEVQLAKEFHLTNDVEKLAVAWSKWTSAFTKEVIRGNLLHQGIEKEKLDVVDEIYDIELPKMIKENIHVWEQMETFPTVTMVISKVK